jgi:hypothetical protein
MCYVEMMDGATAGPEDGARLCPVPLCRPPELVHGRRPGAGCGAFKLNVYDSCYKHPAGGTAAVAKRRRRKELPLSGSKLFAVTNKGREMLARSRPSLSMTVGNLRHHPSTARAEYHGRYCPASRFACFARLRASLREHHR